MKLNVDNLDRGDVQTMSTGSMVQDTDVILGKETFNGCIRNFYMRRLTFSFHVSLFILPHLYVEIMYEVCVLFTF